MRRTALRSAIRATAWVLLGFVVIAPCLHHAARTDLLGADSKHVQRPIVPWASTEQGVTLERPIAPWAPPTRIVARLPLLSRSPFVPPEA
jgi:hypothetical protein